MARRNQQRKFTQPAPSSPVNAPFSTEDDLQKEYVGGYGLSSGLETRIPPQRRDSRTQEVTFETLRQMMNDSEISSDVRTLVSMVLADGMQVQPAIEGRLIDDGAPEFKQAEMIAAHCTRSFAGLKKSLKKTLKGILEGALAYGHKTAEITWKIGVGEEAGRLVLAKISQKDHRVLDFVVDSFWNHIGFIPRVFNLATDSMAVIPREKFLHFSLLEEDEDPRGRSWIRPVNTAWCFKVQTWPEYFRWLENCALPTTIGKTAPKQPGDVARNADGMKKTNSVLLSPAEAMGQALGALKNASYAVIPSGAEVEQFPPATDGQGFERGIHVADSQIAKGILYQTLATGEAQHGTRAQSQTHLNVLDLIVWELKGDLADTITKDIVEQMVRYNFGEEMLKFAPLISFGDSERRDWSKDATAASLLEGALTDSQWNAITNQLGIPAPLVGEQPRRQASMPVQPANQPGPPANEPPPKRGQQNGAFVSLKVRAK